LNIAAILDGVINASGFGRLSLGLLVLVICKEVVHADSCSTRRFATCDFFRTGLFLLKLLLSLSKPLLYLMDHVLELHDSLAQVAAHGSCHVVSRFSRDLLSLVLCSIEV